MKVEITSKVHFLLTTYALSNEHHEICCLLLGHKSPELIKVTSIVFTTRSEIKSDRVEISDEQLCFAMEEAERQHLFVVGWMHSHPKITVPPSHVDLKTQADLQRFDSLFIGLIYSCYHETTSKTQLIQFTCFQTSSDMQEVTIPINIVPSENDENLDIKEMLKVYVKEQSKDSDDPLVLMQQCSNLLQISRDLVKPLLNK